MSVDRFELPFFETMEKYHGEIERQLYAAEIACCHRLAGRCTMRMPHAPGVGCSFILPDRYCMLVVLRGAIGDHVEQHDMPVVKK
jgi:hypothetical protein